MSRTPARYRWFLPLWLWTFFLLVAAVMGGAQASKDRIDPGLANILIMLLLMVSFIVVSVWYLFLSRFERRTRFLTFVGVLLTSVVFVGLFRFDGFSGSMVPLFALRSAQGSLGSRQAGELPGGIDLNTTTLDDFPGFLGPDRSMTVSHVRLSHDWQSEPPEEIWRQPIGAGWSAFAVVNAYAVTMELRGEEEMVTAYDLRTGELQWAYSQPGAFDHPLGGAGPRSTPLIDEGRVFALGAGGTLLALEGATGRVLWRKELLQEFGVTPAQEFANIQYGRSNSPLVVGDLLVVPAGGNADRPPVSLVAYDKRTGEKRWEGGDRQISFSSPRLATLAGVEQILIVNEDTASGHDPRNGRKLWEYPWPGKSSANATASQAVPVPPDGVLLSKGYGEGAALIRLSPGEDGAFQVQEVWHNRRVLRTKFSNVVLLDGFVYGLSQGILECVDVQTGDRVWKRGRYGHGQMLLVDRTLLILTEEGELVHVELTPDRPNRVLGRFQALEGPTWNNIALYGAYVVLRNAREAAVYRLPLQDSL